MVERTVQRRCRGLQVEDREGIYEVLRTIRIGAIGVVIVVGEGVGSAREPGGATIAEDKEEAIGGGGGGDGCDAVQVNGGAARCAPPLPFFFGSFIPFFCSLFSLSLTATTQPRTTTSTPRQPEQVWVRARRSTGAGAGEAQ
jgi:hypothetical protein